MGWRPYNCTQHCLEVVLHSLSTKEGNILTTKVDGIFAVIICSLFGFKSSKHWIQATFLARYNNTLLPYRTIKYSLVTSCRTLVFQYYSERENASTRLIQPNFRLYQKKWQKLCFPIKIAKKSDSILSSCRF